MKKVSETTDYSKKPYKVTTNIKELTWNYSKSKILKLKIKTSLSFKWPLVETTMAFLVVQVFLGYTHYKYTIILLSLLSRLE